MSELKVFAREAFFIKKSDIKPVDYKALMKRHTHHFFEGEGKHCQECEFNAERIESEDGLSDQCPNCAAYKGGVTMVKDVIVGKNKYVSIPAGDRKGIQELFKHRNIVFKSKRPKTEMKRRIKFTGELRDYQREAVDAIKATKYGVVKAPPRSGKTVLSTAAICEIGGKTLIMAAQKEWLDGFYETFCGSDTQKPLTNAKKSQVGYCKKLEDFEKYDVCLVTVATFHSERGQKLLKKIRDWFTVLVCDEVHMSAAAKYAIAVSKLNTRYRIGLSGTPSRKDGRYLITEALFGPILFQAKVEQLRPKVSLVRTEFVRPKQKGGRRPQWATIVKSLESDPKRLKLIAKWAIKDAKAGHMVLIPLTQVTPIKALTLAINKLAGKKMAHAFWGGLEKTRRKQLIQDARTYKARILVGNSKLVSVGTNIPRASMLYDVTYSSNLENAEQRTARVLTPYEDKPAPGLRIFLDNCDIRRNCLRKEWFHAVVKKFRPHISEQDDKLFKAWFNDKRKQEAEFASWQL
jgi:superfamily II DNA or RNA helicase